MTTSIVSIQTSISNIAINLLESDKALLENLPYVAFISFSVTIALAFGYWIQWRTHFLNQNERVLNVDRTNKEVNQEIDDKISKTFADTIGSKRDGLSYLSHTEAENEDGLVIPGFLQINSVCYKLMDKTFILIYLIL